MGLFMRPIVPPAPVHSVIRLVGAGGYRMFLDYKIIGAIIIGAGQSGQLIGPQSFQIFLKTTIRGVP